MTVCTILFPRTKLCFILFISFFYRWRTLISLASTLSLSVVTTKWTSVEMWSLRRNSSSTSRFDYECVVFYFKLCMWKCNLKFTKKQKKTSLCCLFSVSICTCIILCFRCACTEMTTQILPSTLPVWAQYPSSIYLHCRWLMRYFKVGKCCWFMVLNISQ